jgi:beta-lactamase regulating signal transducer with metallopeptidase domain/uncharacterized protein YukE
MEFSNDIIRSLGMTLVHSLWQGAIISVIMLSLLSLIGKSNARLRYVVLFSGLMLLLAGFITTLIFVHQQDYFLTNWKNSSQQVLLPPEYTLSPLWSYTPGRFAEWLFSSLEPVYPALAIGWLAGFLFIGIRITGGTVLARVNLRKNLMNPDVSLQNTFDRIQNLLKLPVLVRLRITTRTISPMVIGLIKPMVIIPVAAISGLSTSQIEAVMFHELAHIRRFDHFLVILQAIAEQVLFFNPTAWFLLREINLERENCCDDFVVKTNNNTINYIKALTMIQEMNLHSNVPANAITGKSNHLLNRVRRLVKPELKHSPAFRLAVVFLFFATVGVSAMTLLVSGKPGELFSDKDKSGNMLVINDFQSDSTGKVVMNGTFGKVSGENRDGDKKKMKIVFLNDTIKEMTINGKEITKEEMKNYEDEIRKIRQDMETSQKELEKAHQELEEAQKELQMARQQLAETRNGLEYPGDPEMRWQFKEPFSQAYMNPEQFKKLMQSEEFQEQMKKAREEAGRANDEARRAMEEIRMKGQEYWQQHQKEIQEQMKKAQEEIRISREEYWKSHQKEFQEQMKKVQEETKRAFEEMKKNKELYDLQEFPYLYRFHSMPEIGLPLLPETEILIPEVPEIEELIPVDPAPSVEMLLEEPAAKDSQDSESLNSKLKELEEGER